MSNKFRSKKVNKGQQHKDGKIRIINTIIIINISYIAAIPIWLAFRNIYAIYKINFKSKSPGNASKPN